MSKVFIIEHMEPELWPWCMIEYKHISKILGKKNLWFTHINEKDRKKLIKYGKVFSESAKNLGLKKACILDPGAHETLSPSNSADYEFFIFGGILGDNPPKKRTKQELTKFMKGTKTFNIGKEQMSTDNAAYTVKEILLGRKLSDLKFKKCLNIRINKVQSTQLPYKYNLVRGKPLVSQELIRLIKKTDKV